MKIENAIKKIEKITGQKPTERDGKFYVDYLGYSISFFRNGRESENITCIYTIRDGMKDDSMTDYFPGTFHDNLSQAFAFVDRQAASAEANSKRVVIEIDEAKCDEIRRQSDAISDSFTYTERDEREFYADRQAHREF